MQQTGQLSERRESYLWLLSDHRPHAAPLIVFSHTCLPLFYFLLPASFSSSSRGIQPKSLPLPKPLCHLYL